MTKPLISLFVVLTLVMPAMPALASFDQFEDVQGHWARAQLEGAYKDALIEGYEDGTLRPDAQLTWAQVCTLVCRVLSPLNAAEYSTLGLSGSEWYAAYAAGAAQLGADLPPAGTLNEPISRGDAFVFVAQAFQLIEANPDHSALSPYSDTVSCTGEARAAIAALVSGGYINGYGDMLNLNGSITRAEFVTVLRRIADKTIEASSLRKKEQRNVILTGKCELKDIQPSGTLILDCRTTEISFSGVEADKVVILSQKTNELSLKSGTKIDRMIIACGTGEDISISIKTGCEIGTLVIGDCDGAVAVRGNVGSVELTGSGQKVYLDTKISDLIISGRDNEVSVQKGGEAQVLSLMPIASGNELKIESAVSELTVYGSANSVTVNAAIKNLRLGGKDNSIAGSGRAAAVELHSGTATLDLRHGEITEIIDAGIENAAITIDAPRVLPIGERLLAVVTVESETERECLGTWLYNGTELGGENVIISAGKTELRFEKQYEYFEELEKQANLEFRLSYTYEDGRIQTRSVAASVQIENYDESYYKNRSIEHALATVKNEYAGDGTTQWAEENDYDRAIKETWINAKGYESATGYLIWISREYQRVNVFSGEKGNWQLAHTFLCGTGAELTPTPVGVYTVWMRSSYGWTTGTYNVRPVVNFNVGSGYAFHSRLYDPSHSYLTDPSIGFPVSHGCIRMYDEDVTWLYDNIPDNTTVVVF